MAKPHEAPDNPFTNRAMIKTEAEFVGRRQEVAQILSYVKKGTSVSVVGERRIGKSSLVYHLYLTGNRRLGDAQRQRFHFAYLDCHSAEFKTPATFVESVLNKLETSLLPELGSQDPMVTLEWYLKKHQADGKPRPIVILDEFEVITKHTGLFNDHFLESLRSICNSGLLTLLTVSKYSLKELTHRQNLTSPFYNIFPSRTLEGFRVDQHTDEVEEFIQAYWEKEIGIAPRERKFLQQQHTRHPLALQIISYHLLENRNYGYGPKKLRRLIQKDLYDLLPDEAISRQQSLGFRIRNFFNW